MRMPIFFRSALAAGLFVLCANAGAIPNCPTSHFQPLLHFGWMYGDADPVVTADLSKSSNDEVVFQYLEFPSHALDPGYKNVYLVALVRSEAGKWHAALVRQRGGAKAADGAIDIKDRAIDAARAKSFMKNAIAVLRRTHYPPTRCKVAWVDGYGAQAFARDDDDFSQEESAARELIGEVYVPPEGSEAETLVKLSRAMRAYVEGQADEAKLDASLISATSLLNSGQR